MQLPRAEGCACVSFESDSALEEGLTYLIREEGCRHICLLEGPPTNTDVKERRQVYLDTLEKYGVEFEPRMCASGDFEDSAVSEQAMEMLLERNPDMDAVFCQNDYMAGACYTVLKRHGLRPGDDIKVLGFDNIADSSTFDPPLATIGADPIVLGEEALKCLARVMNGEASGENVLKARLIHRSSLGRAHTRLQQSDFIEERTFREAFEAIYYRYLFEHTEQENEQLYSAFRKVSLEILQAARERTASGKPLETLMKSFDRFVSSEILPYMDTEAMLRMIDKIADEIMDEGAGKDSFYTHADLPLIIPEIYRCLVQTEGRRNGVIRQRKNVLDEARKAFIKKTLNFQHGNDRGYQVILSCLGWAGITDACLYIFENPVMHLEGESFIPPKEVFMKALLQNGEVKVPPAGKQKRMIMESMIPWELADQSRCMMAAPLYFSEDIYGLFLCNVSETLFQEGEFIVNQLGTAVRMIQLLAQNEAIQQWMEEQMTVIRKMNLELDTLSRFDELTGIRNRRGFMDSAAVFLRELQEEGQPCLIGYADMDNLKVVNDRFGHEEGDYALKTIADILAKTLPKDHMLLGRIGGDEFVFITAGDEENAPEKLKEALCQAFGAFNGTSDKPFNVTVSVGIYPVQGDQSVSLEDALSYADEDLYMAKQRKNRNILKN